MKVRYVSTTPKKVDKQKPKKEVPFHIIIPSAIVVIFLIIMLICFQSNMNMFASVMSDFANNMSVNNNKTNNDLILDPNIQDYNGSFVPDSQSGSIAIPGFEKLRLKPNTTKQSPGFFNPETNSCYFVIELRLGDDTLLYKSGLIPPGKAVYNIDMTQTLEAGSYPATVTYKCYSANTFEEMNGAEVQIILEVS